MNSNMFAYKKYRSLFLLVLCVILIICSSCGNRAEQTDAEPTIDNKTSNYSNTPLLDDEIAEEDRNHAVIAEPIQELLNVYSNVSDLVPVSTIIVTGIVQSNIYYTYAAVATTWYEFRVEECWKGDLRPGDVITIAQNGGYYTSEMFNAHWNSIDDGAGNMEEGLLIKESPLGVPLPQAGDHNLLFLTDWTDGAYCALDTFMARYYITDDGEATRFVPDDFYAEEILRRSTDPTSLAELKQIVQACIEGVYEADSVTMQQNKEMFLAWFEKTGDMTSEEIRSYEQCYDAVLQSVARHAALIARAPTVLVLGLESQHHVAGGDTFQNTMIREAGGINAAAAYRNGGQFSKLTVQEICDLDPDYLVIPSGYRYDAEDILKGDEWKQLRAVRENHIAIVAGGAANCIYPAGVADGTGDPDACIGVAWLHHVINPYGYSEQDYQADLAVYSQANPYTAEAVEAYRVGGEQE